MNILILHRIPYYKVNYHLSIDHHVHKVTYIGMAKNLENLPTHIECKKIERPGLESMADEAIAAIRSENLQFDLVISLSEHELLDAAKIRETFSIPGANVKDVSKVRNKIRMTQVVDQHGIRVPRALTLANFLQEEKAGWDGKTVLKPLDGTSGIDVKIFQSPQALLKALKQNRTGVQRLDQPAFAIEYFEIEEFITGEILHFDGLIKDGRVILVIPSRYVGNRLAYVEGHPLGSVQIDSTSADELWVQKVVNAIGIEQGSFHLEAINENSDKVFLEIANRAGGANVVETIKLATGVHLVAAELGMMVGTKINLKPRRNPGRFGWFIFPGHQLQDGTCRITGASSYINHPMMVRHEKLSVLNRLPRDITYQPTSVPFSGIIRGTSSDEMVKWLEKMFHEIKVKSIHEIRP